MTTYKLQEKTILYSAQTCIPALVKIFLKSDSLGGLMKTLRCVVKAYSEERNHKTATYALQATIYTWVWVTTASNTGKDSPLSSLFIRMIPSTQPSSASLALENSTALSNVSVSFNCLNGKH